MVDFNKWKRYAKGDEDMTRRDFIKAGGAAAGSTALVVDAVDDDDDMYSRTAGVAERFWNWATPDSFNFEISYGDEDNNAGNGDGQSGNGGSGNGSGSSGDWRDEFGLGDLSSELDEESTTTRQNLEEYISTAYSEGGGEINYADVDGNDLVVNNLRVSLYDRSPGLDMTRDLGDKLSALDSYDPDSDGDDRLTEVFREYAESNLS